MNNTWQNYYEQTKNRPPSKLLIKALPFVIYKHSALDLGSGALKDSKYLLQEGFKELWAIDKEPIKKELLQDIDEQKFHFIQTSFDQFKFPLNKFDLINASYSIPFNQSDSSQSLWKSIVTSLVSGGIFTGQMFGVHDEWNMIGNTMTFYTADGVRELFKDFEIIDFEEEEKDGTTASGKNKHWHVFHIIARKLN